MPAVVETYLRKLHLPQPQSHKGQNGKVMVIGGSELFHSASRWSLDTIAHFVDMVFYASVPSNNVLVQAEKGQFWNGMVIERAAIESYLSEADVVLIGPGMTRTEELRMAKGADFSKKLSEKEWQGDTERVVNYVLSRYPQKKWVIDAGALQMVAPSLLTKSCIVTPHPGELARLLAHVFPKKSDGGLVSREQLIELSSRLLNATILVKGPQDRIAQGDKYVEVSGGNAGMTKGGTGDVLAGLVAALYATHDALPAAVGASVINKRAGDLLYKTVGPFFTTTELVGVLPQVAFETIGSLAFEKQED